VSLSSSSSPKPTYASGRPPIPAKCTDPEDKTQVSKCSLFLDHVLNQDSLFHRYKERSWNRSRLYRQGQQWNEPARDNSGDLTYTNWRPMRVDRRNMIPMPVVNVFGPAIENESARLVKVGSRPYIRAESTDPEVEAAAELAKDVVVDIHDRLGFNDQQRDGSQHMPEFGQWIERWGWEVDWLKLTPVPVSTAVGCDCGFSLREPSVPPEHGQQFHANRPGSVLENVEPPDDDDPLGQPVSTFTAKACPQCPPDLATGSLRPLQPKPLSMDEAQTPDSLGRPMTDQYPLGDVYCEMVSCFDYFPESGGVDVTDSTQLNEEGFIIIRSLDWIRRRFPKNGKLVKAETATEMYERHPWLGAIALAGGASSQGVLDNHCRVREWHLKRSMDFPRGRSIMEANGVLLMDEDFQIESSNNPGTYIERCWTELIQHEKIHRQLWGLSLGEAGLFSTQDNINVQKSQAIDIRQKWTNPKMMVRDGVDMTAPGGAGSRYPADVWTFASANPDDKPTLFGSVPVNPSFWQEFDRDLAHAQQLTGAQAADVGNIQPGQDLNYSALLFAAQKSAERRQPRIDRMRDAKRRGYRYVLRLVEEFYREERLIRVRGKNDEWSVRKFMGKQLMGQNDVDFEDEPIVDAGVAKRAAINQAFTMGSINVQSVSVRRRVNRHLEVPMDVDEDDNAQIECAQREFIDYLEDGDEPAVDRQADAHNLHWEQHVFDLMGEKAAGLKREAKAAGLPWSKVLLATSKWEEKLGQLEAFEQELAQGPPRPDPAVQQDPRAAAMAAQSAQVQQQQFAQMGQIVQSYPQSREERIVKIWTDLVTQAVMPPPPPPPPQQFDLATGQPLPAPPPPPPPQLPEPIKKLIRFQAHALDHRKEMQAQSQAEQAGMVQPTAPGTQPGGPTGGPQADQAVMDNRQPSRMTAATPAPPAAA
jgi:hypothetical protein